MKEAEWLTCTHPDLMLQHLDLWVTHRKVRLFACACCRRIWHLLTDERSRRAVEIFERCADGLGSGEEVREALAEAEQVGEREKGPKRLAARAVATAWSAEEHSRSAAARAVAAQVEECRRQAGFLRDIIGNPFQPVPVDLAWLEWRDGLVTQIARSIYDERRFDDLPILADALEEAGCTEERILDHCRGRGRHTRGCWVLDGLLGAPLAGVPLGTPGSLAVREVVEQEGRHVRQFSSVDHFASVTLRMEPHVGSPPVLFFNATKPVAACPWVPSIEVALARFCAVHAERGRPMGGMRIILTGFRDHPVDSSARAFEQAAVAAIRKALGLDRS